MRDTSTAGNSLELTTTTSDQEILQNTQGNDLEHSNNVVDGTIRIEELRISI
jgi:hypothetical protein